MKVAVKEPGKELAIMDIDAFYRREVVEKFVDNDVFDYVFLDEERTLCMGVDEEGLLKCLEKNFVVFTPNHFFPVQQIVGTAVFFRMTGRKSTEDYFVEDITEEDIEYINKLLSEPIQVLLSPLVETRPMQYFTF